MIAIKPSHKGLLHAKLGVPQGKPIPTQKLNKALQSPSPTLRKEANFAKNAKGFNHQARERKPRTDKGERKSLHPQSHDEFIKLGHTESY